MSIFPPEIEELAGYIVSEFSKRDLMVATAESCTGGLIAGSLTEISGSSAVVDRGFTTYSNDAKMDMLGVTPQTLEAFGAVSKETALQMAHGALLHSKARYSVAVTGIAGPGGGSALKPVGLVHLAVESRSGKTLHREMHYGDIGRGKVRLATVVSALDMLIEISGIQASA